ncbi:MATE family efflux transporter [Roseburia intestinalis]|uniref:Probable multidrug resistance protein NorM n=2 Tax=Roseburia intestinalis L1-82 TaxID=536231 RepID=C7G5M4_9FIRM|nr:MATE family efflux transporter [Roseburia intestinalis]EEV02912.1 MATE efflux family protein [Roseburia intestinalis L1-82]UWP55945.1 MATE family efflux transporter [Roseburia intestinalis]
MMNENKMETMQVNKLLITMAAPMVLSMLIGALYNVVDSLFVSHYGENALSAVSLAFPIQNIIIATGTGIGVGINALLSRFLGEKKQKKVNQTALHGIILGIGFYILVLLFGIFCVKGFYMVQTNDTEIISMGVDYLTVICVFGYFGLPEMGTKGAPIATVVGQIIAMLLGLYFNLTKNTDVQFNFKSIELESYYFKGICTVGIPTIIMQSMSSIMCFGINKLLLNFSTTSTAVFGAYFKLQTFVYMATFGLNNVLIPIVAFNLGAKHADRIKKVIRLSGAYSALIGLVGLIIMEMLPVQLISAFAPSEEMFSLGVTALRILGFSFVFGGVSVMTCYALQGFSRGISSLIISALRQVIILLPLASILGKAIGINGIWWSFLISETVTVIRNVRHRFQSSNPQK